jgi:nucleoid DNA-binding protein
MVNVHSHLRRSKKGKLHGVVSHDRTLTKSALVARVHEDFEHIPRKEVSEIIDAEHRVIGGELKKGHSTRIAGFGTFRIVKKKARPARRGINPFTQKVQLFKAKPARRAVKFKLSKDIKI